VENLKFRAFCVCLLLTLFCFQGVGAAAGESAPSWFFRVWTVTVDTDSPSNPEAGSLRHAVQNARILDTIRFADGKRNISLLETLVVDKPLIIEGPAVLTQTGSGAVLVNSSEVLLKITGLTFSGGSDRNMGYAGAGVINGGSLMLTDCTMTGNRTYWQGAGVKNTGTLEMIRCVVRNNASNTGGGGVFSSGTLSMTDCEVDENVCYDDAGGGIYNKGALTMLRCTVRNNRADSDTSQNDYYLGTDPGDGGGISNKGGTATLTECTITGNAGYWGGGIYSGYRYNQGFVKISDSTISGNTAQASGGGVYSYNGSAEIENSRISDNTAGLNGYYGYGGGIALSQSSAALSKQTVVTGNAPDQIYCSYAGSYTTDDTCTIGTAPGSASVSLSGFAEGASPSPRRTVGEADVDAVERDLNDPESEFFKRVKNALSDDLGGLPGEVSESLYNAFAYEDVPLSDTSGEGKLTVEFTASWPENVRYYAAFAEYEDAAADTFSVKEYAILERSVQFEIQPGQPLPDGVTPPDFYEEGEGLMTWRNVVEDNGQYDHNREAGIVTFRVASVRAEAETRTDFSGSSGCSAGGVVSPFALLSGIPLMFVLRRIPKIRPQRLKSTEE